MKKISLKCENCGAIMKVSEDKTEATCPYCKYKFLIEKEPTISELQEKEEKLSYAREKGKRDAINDTTRTNKTKNYFTTLLIIFITIGVVALIGYGIYNSLEELEDPFTCIDINFTGKDGTGSATIVNNNTCEYYSKLEYSLSKDSNLSEDEEIKVSVISSSYRLKINEKIYKVKGLNTYLNNLNDLNEKTISDIHEISYKILKNVKSTSFSGTITSLEPYKIYLRSNNKKNNTLYDVYKVKIKTSSGKVFEKYMVASYEDFILFKESNTFSYINVHYVGNTVQAGDPNVISASNKDYAGFITGFLTIEDFKLFINSSNDGTYIMTEK